MSESLVPLYILPTAQGNTCTSASWRSVAFGGSRVTAIINPNSGPIPSTDGRFSAYLACMMMLQAAGVRVVGYVPTKTTTYANGVWTQTGFRPAASVNSMVDMYHSSAMGPLLSGIFVDEVSGRYQATNSASWGDHTAYYRALFSVIRARNSAWSVVANPGSFPPDGLLGASTGGADVVVVFEGDYSTRWDPTATGSTCEATLWTNSQGSFSPGPWCPWVPNWDGIDSLITQASQPGGLGSELAALVYGASAATVGTIRTQAIAAHVTTLYATDSSLWNTLPSWWCQSIGEAAGTECLSSPPPPPPPITQPEPEPEPSAEPEPENSPSSPAPATTPEAASGDVASASPASDTTVATIVGGALAVVPWVVTGIGGVFMLVQGGSPSEGQPEPVPPQGAPEPEPES